MRKVLFGFLWLVVFYMGGAMLIGGIVGFQIGLKYPHDPERVSAEASIAGEQAVQKNLPLLAGGSITLAILGTAFGLLPGTRSRPQESNLVDHLPEDFTHQASTRHPR
jgi:hypothetical protein